MEKRLQVSWARRGAAAALAGLMVTLGGCASLVPAPVAPQPSATLAAATPAASTTLPSPLAPPASLPAPAPAPSPAATSAPVLTPSLSVAAAPGADAPLRTLIGPEDEDPALRADLWERVRAGFALPDLDSELVRRWETWYSSRPDYVRRMTERAGRYLFHIVEEVSRRQMPMELALLPFIESAFNPQALSVASAAGIWQFMPATGRDFELRQNLFRDDRRDVLASTRAALDYLQSLHRMFDDWHLALAAYNWGQGNVQRALERNRRSGLAMSYPALRMPDETRNYVPKLQAVKNIIARPGAFGLDLPPLENHPFFLSVAIERDIDVELAASLAGLPVDEFRMLNPQLNKPVILAAGTPQLLLPYDNANRFVRAIARHTGPLASWTAWVAPKTLKPAEAARLSGMSEASLRQVNRIPPGMLVRAGSTLVVPRTGMRMGDVEERLAQTASLSLTPEAAAKRKRKATTAPATRSPVKSAPKAAPGRAQTRPVSAARKPGEPATKAKP